MWHKASGNKKLVGNAQKKGRDFGRNYQRWHQSKQNKKNQHGTLIALWRTSPKKLIRSAQKFPKPIRDL